MLEAKAGKRQWCCVAIRYSKTWSFAPWSSTARSFISQLHSCFGGSVGWPNQYRILWYFLNVMTWVGRLALCSWVVVLFVLTVNLHFWSKINRLFWIAWVKHIMAGTAETLLKPFISSADVEESAVCRAQFKNVACHGKFRSDRKGLIEVDCRFCWKCNFFPLLKRN